MLWFQQKTTLQTGFTNKTLMNPLKLIIPINQIPIIAMTSKRLICKLKLKATTGQDSVTRDSFGRVLLKARFVVSSIPFPW